MSSPMLYFVARQNLDEGFWRSEIQSVLRLFGCFHEISQEDAEHFPFIRVHCTREQAIQAGKRSIMVKRVLEVFASGSTLSELLVGFEAMQQRPSMPNPSVLGPKKHSFPYQDLLQATQHLPKSQSEDARLYVLNQGEGKHWAVAAKNLAEGCYDLVTKYNLKTRNYLGPTSLTSELSFLMANLALVQPSSFVLDPYFGTGGALIAALHFKANVFGLDIDWRMLKEGIAFATFDQYGLPRPDVIRGDFSKAGRPFREGVKLDAIIADPPYGIRAGARKTGENGTKIKPEFLDSHIPQMQRYESAEVIQDLLDAAFDMLKLGGRIVYLFPVETAVWRAQAHESLPKREGLRLLYAGHDQLRLGMSRILVTMERVELHQEESKKQRLVA
ncbi:hypothetical protein BASA81_001507 [Batrachochytrium salamandrivorans]|nr:hypothetical protein BASA81_001507 [Batrachochytrium salamandrivorans]